jgi:hypothetical protein
LLKNIQIVPEAGENMLKKKKGELKGYVHIDQEPMSETALSVAKSMLAN